jgi:hypothetical protein
MDIESAINETVKEYLSSMRKSGVFYGPKGNKVFDVTAWDINNGLCEDFAEEIEKNAFYASFASMTLRTKLLTML